jgi:hypothetical protein
MAMERHSWKDLYSVEDIIFLMNLERNLLLNESYSLSGYVSRWDNFGNQIYHWRSWK